jgi:DNA polymerase elongation subunit (family B)
MKLVNIHNNQRQIYIFCRELDGKQTIIPVNSFFPYFYEEHESGNFRTFTGKKVQKIICASPTDIAKRRSNKSWESDILLAKRYLIDRVVSIDKTNIKYCFIDIETLSKELPNTQNPIYTISCISLYNSLYKSIQTFYIEDYKEDTLDKQEGRLLNDLVTYLKKEKFDLFIGWNVNFDYNYLYNRFQRLYQTNFAQLISPVTQSRFGLKEEQIDYPAGISILDYLTLFKKIYSREASYALDYIAQKHLNEEAFTKVDFSKLSSDITDKNINDIRRMIALENKYKIISYYDEIRRMAKCLWEDMSMNSKIIDQICLEEAKNKKVVLPKKPEYDFNEEVEESFEGAYRRADVGAYFGKVYKLDLGSAYPNAIINFCLDTANINEQGLDINGVKFQQNENTILPSVAKKLLIQKAKLKTELKSLIPETEIYQDTQIKYDAIKAMVNSLFGVTGLRIFRLYDMRVASSITFLIRDLLHYVENKVQEHGYKIIYVDTDSVFIVAENNPLELVNKLVQEWAKEKYNKDTIDIEFECEGYFEKLLIVAMCRYCGYLNQKRGIKKEIKGIEAKRKDSSIFMSEFQTNLIEKILNQEEKSTIITWIKEEIERIKTLPIHEIAFPCKIAAEKEYVNEPIFKRALRYTQDILKFDKLAGDLFYWIYVESSEKDETKKTKQNKNVLAFDLEQNNHVKNIDWDKMIERNIYNKVETIFEALKWDMSEIKSEVIKKKRVKKNDK